MGKYSLLITIAVAGAITMLAYSGDQTALDTSDRQSRRQGKVLARQVARSGYNAVLSEARLETQEDESISKIVSDVGTIHGKYEGGTYEAWLDKISPTAYRAISIGRFPVGDKIIKYRIGNGYENNTGNPPEVDVKSTLNVTFEQSQAGFCSAIYLERVLPGTKPENQPDPEMIIAPGNDRNEESTGYNKNIDPGTKLNFILAVDKDCSHEGDTTAVYPDDYNHVQRSFNQDVVRLNKMKETPYGMVEETTVGSSKGWRVSFEDQRVFSEMQLWDIKENGYPDVYSPDDGDWDWEEETYNGNGWDKNSDGLRDLKDYGDIPDFSDQVFRVGLQAPV